MEEGGRVEGKEWGSRVGRSFCDGNYALKPRGRASVERREILLWFVQGWTGD